MPEGDLLSQLPEVSGGIKALGDGEGAAAIVTSSKAAVPATR